MPEARGTRPRIQDLPGSPSFGAGDAGKGLTWDGAGWVKERMTPRGCVVRKSADQAVTTAAHTRVSWDTAFHDPEGWFSDDRITVPEAGVYAITVNIGWDNVTGGGRLLRLLVPFGGPGLAHDGKATFLDSSHSLAWEGEIEGAFGLEAWVYHTRGSNLNLKGPDTAYYPRAEWAVWWKGTL